jgi:maleamate amidohydrolase
MTVLIDHSSDAATTDPEALAAQIEAQVSEVVELLGRWRDATGKTWTKVGMGSRPAIVVIDLARFWTEPQYAAYCPGADDALAAVHELLAHARAAGVPVIFTTQAYQSAAGGLVSATGMARKFPGSGNLAAGSVATELHPSLEVQEGEHLIVKTQSSAFAHTYLSTVLHDAGVDTVILTGVVTSGCVRATAIDSLANGFRTIVVPEAVADHLPGAHQWTLVDVATKIGDVVPLAEVDAYLDGLGAQTRS